MSNSWRVSPAWPFLSGQSWLPFPCVYLSHMCRSVASGKSKKFCHFCNLLYSVLRVWNLRLGQEDERVRVRAYACARVCARACVWEGRAGVLTWVRCRLGRKKYRTNHKLGLFFLLRCLPCSRLTHRSYVFCLCTPCVTRVKLVFTLRDERNRLLKPVHTPAKLLIF